MDEIDEELTRRSRLALARRRAVGEIMTYEEAGWIVREYPGQRIVRLCPVDEFKVVDWPDDLVTAMLREQSAEGGRH